jgi:hypothetical protein
MIDYDKNRRDLWRTYIEKKDGKKSYEETDPLRRPKEGNKKGKKYNIDDFLSGFENGRTTNAYFEYFSKYHELKDLAGRDLDKSKYYQKYVCDKSWAKNGDLCKNSSAQQGGGQQQGGQTTVKNCTGTYNKGCKSDKIKEVQICLGVTPQTGYWGNKTQKAIEEKFPQFKNEFTDSDVDFICDRKQSGTNTTGTNTTVTPQQPSQETKVQQPKTLADYEWEIIDQKNEMNEQETETSTKTPEETFWGNFKNSRCFPSNEELLGLAKAKDDKFQRTGFKTLDRLKETYYIYLTDGTKINLKTKELGTWTCKQLENLQSQKSKYTNLLKKFGIDEVNTETEEINFKIKRIATTLQKWVKLGAVSDDFYYWNKMIESRGLKDIEQLKPEEGNDLYTYEIDPVDLNTNYYEYQNLQKYGWSGLKIYFKKGVSPDTTTVKKQDLDTNKCRTDLLNYFNLALRHRGGDAISPETNELSQNIKNCYRYGKYNSMTPFTGYDLENLTKIQKKVSGFLSGILGRDELSFKEVKKYLRGDDKKVLSDNPYIMDIESGMNETPIRNIIKKTLNEVKETKQKNLIEENIVRTRTFVLLENVKLTNKKREIKFVDEIIKESFFLQSQNFDKQIIKEEFWDVLTGFLGREGSESVFRTFKDRMGDWLVTHLSPNKKEGWIPKAIKKSINKIELRDVEKITDCKFLTKKLTDTIIDSLNEKMMKGETNENGLYDVVKSGMSYDVNHPRFKEELRFKISKMMCPLIDKVSGHLDKAFKTMKEKAIYG